MCVSEFRRHLVACFSKYVVGRLFEFHVAIMCVQCLFVVWLNLFLLCSSVVLFVCLLSLFVSFGSSSSDRFPGCLLGGTSWFLGSWDFAWFSPYVSVVTLVFRSLCLFVLCLVFSWVVGVGVFMCSVGMLVSGYVGVLLCGCVGR